jgi:hypothetical protein
LFDKFWVDFSIVRAVFEDAQAVSMSDAVVEAHAAELFKCSVIRDGFGGEGQSEDHLLMHFVLHR